VTGHAFRIAVLGLLAGAASARTVVAQGSSQGIDSALAGRVDPSVLAEVVAIVDSANAAGLPSGTLVDKALEGSAKHAEPTRIVGAVRALAQALEEARDALGPASTADELTAGAGAIRAGIPPATVALARNGRSGQPVTIPLAVMSELVARGLKPDSAATLVLARTKHGTDDATLADLARETATGAPPSLTATSTGGGRTTTGFYAVPASANPTGGGPPSNTPPSSPHRP
jgi:hypothetical protein